MFVVARECFVKFVGKFGEFILKKNLLITKDSRRVS